MTLNNQFENYSIAVLNETFANDWRGNMRRIIVTDYTRFSEQSNDRCVAGIDVVDGSCVRPMGYLSISQCDNLGVRPGAILEGNFQPLRGASNPHSEDCGYTLQKLRVVGMASSEAFRDVLNSSLSKSVCDGFESKVSAGEKVIPLGRESSRSIITVRVNPKDIVVVENQYEPKKIRVNFTDSSGVAYRYISITDNGFYSHAIQHHENEDLAKINSFMRMQDEVFIRVGLSRAYAVGDRNGYWLQANGIYMFPDYPDYLRP